ncbi:MAG: hypothetical protein MJ252_16905, partial [archaeon]|nr:hypothetical protein [archaeon]
LQINQRRPNEEREIPEFKIKNVERLDEEKKKCPICWEMFKNEENVSALPCIHIFHNGCIGEWLIKNNKCPLCKNPVYERKDEEDEDEDKEEEEHNNAFSDLYNIFSI